MKNLKKKLILIFIVLPLVSCGSFKKALVPEKKPGTDAFLVKKKSPLIMPPSYGELPKPQESEIIEEKKTDIQKLLTGKNNKEKTNNKTSPIEELILKEIKKN